MSKHKHFLLSLFVFLLIIAVSSPRIVFGQGIALRAVSPINESMAGVATATPIDSAGAIHWNPASISGLPSSDISFGMGLVLPSTTLSSSIAAYGLSGSDSGEAGAVPAPSMAFVQKDPDSPWSYGIGILSIGGSAVNYPASTTNPILMPQFAGGLGQLAASVDVFQISPTLAYQLNEHWSIGVAPTVTMGKLYADPLFLAPRYDGAWPAGIGTRYVWGGGVKGGIFCTTDSYWNFGASISSPQWIEPFRYKSITQTGQPVSVTYDMDYPMIVSFGTSYSGFQGWLIGCDVRYFDYANTPGFRHSGFNPDYSLKGLGWNSIMSVAVGIQREFSERFTVRCGYCFNENPITSEVAQYNVASPLITQHTVHVGASVTFRHGWIGSVAYAHAFENSITGQLHNAGGVIPTSSVTSSISADVLSVGISKRY